jgi:hypothetical protein
VSNIPSKSRSLADENKKLLNKISHQPENCENGNDPDLVQAFLKTDINQIILFVS